MTIIPNQLIFLALVSVFTMSTAIALGQGAQNCERYWQSSEVFIGRVERIQRGKSDVYEYLDGGGRQYAKKPVLHISFRVKRTFNGRKSIGAGTLVEVECANCLKGNSVRTGRSYLVYAHRAGLKGSEPLATDRPALVSRMTREIEYLEKLTAPGTIANALNGVAGLLGGRATLLPAPTYPEAAKAARVSGAVRVAIILDPSGKVIRAEVVCGHPLLRATSVAAARLITFKPTKVNGKPIPVGGIVVYNFLSQ